MTVLALTPGPANLFSIATGMERGNKAALVGVLGMNSATLTWFAASALGLGALVVAVPQLFKALTLVGAAYLVWLGLRALYAGVRGEGGPTHALVRPGRSAFRDGFTVQIANPKMVLFFSAVVPPFLDLTRALIPQLAMLALTTVCLDTATMSAYGIGGAALANRMQEPGFRRGFSVVVGLLLCSAAVLIATR